MTHPMHRWKIPTDGRPWSWHAMMASWCEFTLNPLSPGRGALGLFDTGMSTQKIAAAVIVHFSTIRCLRSQFQQFGTIADHKPAGDVSQLQFERRTCVWCMCAIAYDQLPTCGTFDKVNCLIAVSAQTVPSGWEKDGLHNHHPAT